MTSTVRPPSIRTPAARSHSAPGAASGTRSPRAWVPRARTLLPGLVLAGAAALIGWAVAARVPTLSALLVAIVLGVGVANLTARWVGVDRATAPGLAVAARPLLRLGIVLLGLQLSLADIADLGIGVVGLVVAVVATGFLVAERFGRALGVPQAQRTLIGAGMSICGAAAVAAVESSCPDRRDRDVLTAISLVVLFGTSMIPVVPAVGSALHLSTHATAIWAGASIHEVAQVVAAGGVIGAGALQVAVVVKLARVLMLAPVVAILGWQLRRRDPRRAQAARRQSLVPLFLLGFLLAAAVRTTGVLPAAVLHAAGLAQTLLLAAAMFALGTGVTVGALRQVGGRPLLLAAVTTLAVALVGLSGALLLGS